MAAATNTIITPTKVAKEAIVLLKNRLGIANMVHRDFVKDMFNPKGGGTVQVRKPMEYTVTASSTLSKSDSTEYYVTIPAPTQKHVGMGFTSADMTLKVEDFSKRFIAPAVTQLANTVEADILANYKYFPHTVGLPGTTPNAWSYLGNAMQKMDEMGVELEDRVLVINPAARNKLSDALKGLNNPGMVEDLVRRGELGAHAGFKTVFMTQNLPVHTAGTFTTGSTPVKNGNSSAGDTTLVTAGWAASTLVLKAGDVFTVAAVNEVQPRNKGALGYAKQFVSAADVTSSGAGAATITVMDSTTHGLRATGGYQNCSALPLNNAVITPWGATSGLDGAGTEAGVYDINLAFHKNAIALVFFNLETPSSAMGHTEVDPDSGLAVRVIQDYSVTDDEEIWRIDVLYSTKVLDPNRGVRLVGA